MKRITILLADDNKMIRRELKKIIGCEDDIEIIGEAKDGHQVVAMVNKLHPALVLMDISMPLLNGLQATGQILKSIPKTKVLMLSVHSDEVYVAESVKSGAMGYLIKQTSIHDVCTAIREVYKGKTFYSPSIPKRLRKKHVTKPNT